MSSLTSVYEESYKKHLKDIGYAENRQMLTTFVNFYSAVTSSFKWGGMTKNIPFFFPERWLYMNGLCAGFKDGEDFQMFPCFGNGSITDYGLFTSYTLISIDGKSFTKSIDEIELCYNNTLALPSYLLVEELATKCNNALTAVNNTLTRAAFARIIECNDKETLDTILGILSSKDLGKIAIPTLSSAIKSGGVTVHPLFDNKCDDILSLWDVYVRYRNMFYTTFGFDNVEIQKKERLTEAEGSANAEIVRYSLFYDMYECRQNFAERCNNRFGTNLKVEINRNSSSVYNMTLENDEKIENELIEISKGSNIQNSVEKEETENDDESSQN